MGAARASLCLRFGRIGIVGLLLLPTVLAAQDVMANGQNYAGAISAPGEVDVYTFSATAGDVIALAIGETGGNSAFVPWIRLTSPDATLVSSQSGPLAVLIEVEATLTGVYTVQVASAAAAATGTYTLTLAKAPGAFTISPGDEGGALTNGANHTGNIHIGDLDMWSFTANAGEALTVAIGETGPDSEFAPWIRLRSPTGQSLGSQAGTQAAQINATATVAGVYTVVVATGDAGTDAAGSYTLTIANTPRVFTVSAGDQGGSLVIGDPNPGIIHIGDVDMWTFVAHAGDSLTITASDFNSPGFDLRPWIRLRNPDGFLQGEAAASTTAVIVVTALVTGTFTVIVGTADGGLDGFGDYELTVTGPSTNMIRNGDFSNAETFWQFFATPTLAYIVHQVTNGVLQYYRVPPPAGTSNQAVAFQETGVSLPSGAPIRAQFDLANTSTVRKRISVLILDADFSDLSACTFWLEPGAPMRTYSIRTHTTKAWVNTAMYFYAASPGENGGRYEIDNVSMRYVPEQADDRTDCVDPTTPSAPGGEPGPELLVNGNFDTGTPESWFIFGTITWQITNGVFEFIRPTSTLPSGVVAQATGQAMTAGQILSATFKLGNSSAVRKRVTVILHDSDFSDLSACTFWLEPGQPLVSYSYRTFATRPWSNAMLSVYPATTGISQWIRLDDVTLQRTPGTAVVGTECTGPEESLLAPAEVGPKRGLAAGAAVGARASGRAPAGVVPAAIIDGDATRGASEEPRTSETIDLRGASTARLTFESLRVNAESSRALVQVSLDGLTWVALDTVPASDAWTTVQLDLSAYAGEVIRVRFVLGVSSLTMEKPDPWLIRRLEVVIR